MSRLGQDTFSRANQSGLGTASDGQVWSQLSGTMSASIASNEGHLIGQNSDSLFRLGSQTAKDVEAIFRFKCTNFSNDILGLALRVLDSNNFYRPRLFNGNFSFMKFVGGVLTDIQDTAFSATNGQFYWMRYRIVGTTHIGKVWADGTSEPLAWTATVTDTALTSAGGFGLEAWTGSATDTFDFDNLSILPFIPVLRPLHRSIGMFA
jgi:hypothetical protein